jgi:hypothetical protein
MQKFNFFLKFQFCNFSRQRNFKLNKHVLVNNFEEIATKVIDIQRMKLKNQPTIQEQIVILFKIFYKNFNCLE